MTDNETVQAIFDYMQKRAESEGMSHELDCDFYGEFFGKGMRDFFGVIISDDGRLLQDKQNPDFFETYFNK